MITEATISVIGVIIVLITAVGFCTMGGRRQGRGIYALMIAFALIHLIGDGIFRAMGADPADVVISSLNGFGIFLYVVYVVGAIGVLQMGFDSVWCQTHETVKGASWWMLHLPATLLIILAFTVGDPLMAPVLRYMPLLYTLILFILMIWYFEKLERGLRMGLIVTIIGCILMFVANQILHITRIPLLMPVLLMTIGFSWNGRRHADEEDEEPGYEHMKERRDEAVRETGEEPRMKPKPERLEVESPEPVISATQIAYSAGENGEPLSSDTMTTIELSELEELMQKAEIGESILSLELEPDPVPMPVEQLQDMHNLPLMMEKDLNEYYRQMHEAVVQKEYDTCRNILNETAKYRISGIHVTRYERIRHAIEDKDWKTAEKELKSF